MDYNSKYFTVQYELIDDVKSRRYILPVFCFLQCMRGNDYKVLTTKKILIEACGYSTKSRSNMTKYLEEINNSLKFLEDRGYIHAFYSADRFNEITLENTTDISASTMFTIEMNPYIADLTNFGFAAVSVYDYCRILELSIIDENSPPLWKTLALYLFIYKRMWKRKNFLKEVRDNLDKDTVLKNPEFLYMKISTIAEQLGTGFSANVISTILKYMETNNILHHTSLYMGNRRANETERHRKLGTIFVRHSNMWATELTAAEKYKKKQIKEYLDKGGKSDELVTD